MPKTSYPRDRFDDLPDDISRVGVHRAEQPRMRAGVVFFVAALATVVLTAGGIFGMMIISGRIVLFPEPEPVPTPTATVDPVVDTSFTVLVLNATPESGLATRLKDQVVAAGWAPDNVLAGQAGSQDFPETTIYYPTAADYAAALGLAEVIGGARVAESTSYLPIDDPSTEADESAVRQLTIVIGLDRTANYTPSPTATPAS